jgi:hypothetical protein
MHIVLGELLKCDIT